MSKNRKIHQRFFYSFAMACHFVETEEIAVYRFDQQNGGTWVIWETMEVPHD